MFSVVALTDDSYWVVDRRETHNIAYIINLSINYRPDTAEYFNITVILTYFNVILTLRLPLMLITGDNTPRESFTIGGDVNHLIYTSFYDQANI